MINKKNILHDLKKLQKEFDKSVKNGDISMPKFYSKICVLELAGWIEESFDAIANRAIKNLKNGTPVSDSARSVISNTYGFTYKKYFRPMMMSLIGAVNYANLEELLESNGDLAILVSELDTLNTLRVKAAHVHLASTAINFDAPSVTLQRLNKIHPIIKRIYSWVVNHT
tara:strand:+ start:131356 stop:131865 length:510 start_codon:yes stop_codon:yes gene_type:complete